MTRGNLFTAVLFAAFIFSFSTAGQTAEVASAPAQTLVVEVFIFEKGAPAYQRPGEWAWYSHFPKVKEWKGRAGDLPVRAIKITPRSENGLFRVRVTVLKGRSMEVEDVVADVTLTTGSRSTVSELSSFGIVPIQLALALAPTTVAELPSVVTKTRSLEVSTEPTSSNIPTFKAFVLNNSTKIVAAFAWNTSIQGRKMSEAMPRSANGEPLISPGETYERNIRYPLDHLHKSTGEVPGAQSNLVLNITAVVFMDGSYEGDSYDAASYLVFNRGEERQLKRFLDLLRSAAFTGSQDEINSAIPLTFDEAGFTDFLRGFSGFSDSQKTNLRASMEVGKGAAAKRFRAEISGNVFEPVFVKSLIERLEERITSLP